MFLRSEIPAQHPSAAVLGEERLGAGVAVAPDQVLTAHYLVLGAAQAEVTGADGKPRGVRGMALNHETGLALLRLEGPELRPAHLGEGGPVAPGLPVFLLTCTSDRERKGATGHISMVGPFEAFWEYMLDQAIMTTAINPGLAGAPLFDPGGRVIGIVSLGLAAVGRYSLAIPLDLFLQHREEMESEQGVRTDPPRAWVGFYPQGFDGGVAINGIVPGGPGDKAGLARGDLILSVDGAPVSTLRELYRAIWRKGPGESLGLQILRDSSIRVIEVVAGDRYEFYK
ncbi:MAG TPA: S1C family serine protease [Vicinamibacteria bacterium]|nr:S1C family serine protease [Vicinamibacteria bacterium]